jgi:hypothetical protein
MFVTPEHDPAIEAISLAIRDAVIRKWPKAIASVSVIDHVPTDPNAFPHLVVHSAGSVGQTLASRRGVARYLMLASVDQHKMPGQFRAMSLKVAEILREIEDPGFRWSIVQDQQFRCSEKLLAIQGGLIPFFEISFDFVDTTPLG